MDYYKYVSEHKLYDLYQYIMNCLDQEYDVRNVELGLYFTYLVNKEELIYEKKEFNRLRARA